jgi:hypothetical protein
MRDERKSTQQFPKIVGPALSERQTEALALVVVDDEIGVRFVQFGAELEQKLDSLGVFGQLADERQKIIRIA